MNNETNRDEEAFERHFLNWLLDRPRASASPEDGENLNLPMDLGEKTRVEYLEWDEPDPLDQEEFDFSDLESQPHTLGELPTVQDRFQTLLKERLKVEIQRNPPLFPWESEVREYDRDYPDESFSKWVPPLHLWTAQLQNLRWGRWRIPITETVFAQLLEPCQEVVQSSLREGAKMVRAVDRLFPGQSEALNEVAGLVLKASWRDGVPEFLKDVDSLTNYEGATPDEQMALSLLAARAIISSLMLECALNQPPVQRQWLTAMGLLTLEAQYLSNEAQGSTSLRVRGQLPEGGSLQLKGQEIEATTERLNPGYLCVELLDPQPDRTYSLTVQFQNADRKSLKFAICPTVEMHL